MDHRKLGTVVGYTLLLLGVSCAVAYVAGYFIFVFINC